MKCAFLSYRHVTGADNLSKPEGHSVQTVCSHQHKARKAGRHSDSCSFRDWLDFTNDYTSLHYRLLPQTSFPTRMITAKSAKHTYTYMATSSSNACSQTKAIHI